MRILVTGGTGVIGNAAITELLTRGHQIRLLSRHAEDDARQWRGVEPFDGNVADADSIRGAANACDAVLHIAGIAAEKPPEITFENVNVGGTRNVIAEMQRAGVRRLLFVSSLGADTGSSDYHRSKLAAEGVVQESGLDWTIVRPGGVYGPGDEVISTILKMVRTLPAVPVIDGGDQPFQPVWHEDLAKALATMLERDDLRGRVLEIGGELTSMNDVVDRLRKITGREPARVSVPSPLASLISKVLDTPIDDTKLTMLREDNTVRGDDGLKLLGMEPTPLDDGLRALAETLPESLPEDGFGKMEAKRFWADIRGTTMDATQLMSVFRERITEIMPIEFEAEPNAPTTAEEGTTLTAALPMRGNIQVRVERSEPQRITLATIEGHPLAGIVEFLTRDLADGVRFTIDIHARSANLLDFIAMKTVGHFAQDANWRSVVQRMIEVSGGTSDGVQSESRKLDADEAKAWEESVRGMVQARARG